MGIGLTICAYKWFHPRSVNTFSGREERDLSALRDLVESMLGAFRSRYHESEEECGCRLEATMPVAPWDDVFDRMSNRQMEQFKTKLEALSEALKKAEDEADPHEAAKVLERQFGSDFPVPTKEESAKSSSRPAITKSHSSA